MDRNDLLAATRDQFLRSFTESLPLVVERSVPALFHKAEKAQSGVEERRFFDVRTVLTTRGDEFKKLATKNLEQLVTRSFQTAYSTFKEGGMKGTTTSALSLLDQTAFEVDLRIDNITQLFRDEADEQLRDLNIRIALLFGQETIKERENPFRPYLLTRSIVNAVDSLDLANDLDMVLIDQLCEVLIKRIDGIYAALNKLLSEHGIAAQLPLKIRKVQGFGAASEMGKGPNSDMAAAEKAAEEAAARVRATGAHGQVSQAGLSQSQGMQIVSPQVRSQRRIDRLISWVRSPGGAPGPVAQSGHDAPMQGQFDPTGGGEAGNAGAAGAPHSTWLQSGDAVGGVLRRVFSSGIASVELPGGYAPSEVEPEPEVDFDPTVPHVVSLGRSLQVMVRDHTPTVEAMYDSTGAIRNLILEKRPELGGLTDKAHEQMTIDIVAMLFEFILRDNDVPAEVRAQLGRLQFLVLKIALRDPTFFNHKSHPARMLVNRIGSISLSLRQVDPSGVRLTAEIRRIVQKLLEDTGADINVVADVLDEFDQFVARELRASAADVELAVKAMESVESRTLQFARITSMIAEGLSSLKVETKLHDFLVHTWARVVERAGRDDGTGIAQEDAQALRALVPDLVWSIAPKVTEPNRKQLIGMLPRILRTLRSGLTLIDWSNEQKEELLSWLVDSHTFALRAVNVGGVVPPLSFVHDRFRSFLDAAEFAAKAATVKVEDTGHIDTALMNEAIREMKVNVEVIGDEFEKEFAASAADGASVSTSLQTTTAASTADSVADQGATTEAEDAEVIRRLHSGVAVEVNLYGKPSLATLTWASTSATNFVLTMDGRRTPAVVSAKLFRWLLKNERARFIENTGLFERAMTSLVASADASDKENLLAA